MADGAGSNLDAYQNNPADPVVFPPTVDAPATPDTSTRTDASSRTAADLILKPGEIGPKTEEQVKAEALKAQEAKAKADEAANKEKEALAKIPEGEGKEIFLKVKKDLEARGETGPLVNGFLAIFALLAQYGGLMDLLPGRFEEKVKEKTDKFSDEETRMIKAALAKKELKAEAEAAIKAKLLEEGKGKKVESERASTKYASHMLWGIDNIEDSVTLLSKLQKTTETIGSEQKNIYEEVKFIALGSKEIPFGTVIVFTKDIAVGQRLVAFATGDKDQFRYFDGESVVTFNLSSPDSPIKSPLAVRMCMRPVAATSTTPAAPEGPAAPVAPAPPAAPPATPAPLETPPDSTKK